jgi:hypothetical protein
MAIVKASSPFRADVIGEKKETAIEYHAVSQHRPRATKMSRAYPELRKLIDLALSKVEPVQMSQPNHPLVGTGVQ